MPENLGKVISVLSTTDFSAAASQYLAMGLDANGKLVLPATNGRILGVLQNTPAAGQDGSVVMDGVTQGIAGAAVTAGDMLMVNNAGQFITFVPGAGKYMVGWAAEGASALGVRFSVILKTPGSLT